MNDCRRSCLAFSIRLFLPKRRRFGLSASFVPKRLRRAPGNCPGSPFSRRQPPRLRPSPGAAHASYRQAKDSAPKSRHRVAASLTLRAAPSLRLPAWSGSQQRFIAGCSPIASAFRSSALALFFLHGDDFPGVAARGLQRGYASLPFPVLAPPGRETVTHWNRGEIGMARLTPRPVTRRRSALQTKC